MKKYIYGLFVILCSSVGSLLGAGEKPFVVGTTSGYAPFVSLNDKGEYEGFDIDLIKEVATKLGRPLEFKDFGTMPSLMLALKQRKVDAIIWAISITDERKESFEMIHYQGDRVDTVPILFWGEIPEGIESLEDLAKVSGKPVSVEAGSYQEAILKSAPKISLKFFDGVQNAILDLKYKKSLASALDPAVLPRFLKKYPQLKVLTLPLPKAMQSEGNGICVNRGDKELAVKIQTAIEALKAEGVIFQLEKKWGLRSDE